MILPDFISYQNTPSKGGKSSDGDMFHTSHVLHHRCEGLSISQIQPQQYTKVWTTGPCLV